LIVAPGAVVAARLSEDPQRRVGLIEAGPSDVGLPDGSPVAPGSIDVHTHGADEFLFNRDQGNAVEVASRAYARQGATGYLQADLRDPGVILRRAAEVLDFGQPAAVLLLGGCT